MSRLTIAPSRTSKSACPVCSTPERPAMRRQRSRASAASAGLPSGLPWNSSRESAPITIASVSRLATSAALAAASNVTCSATRGAVCADSSTSPTTTSGASPACRSSDNRAGDAEASTRLLSEKLTHTSRRPANHPAPAAAGAGARGRRTPTRRPAWAGAATGAGPAPPPRLSVRPAPRPTAPPGRRAGTAAPPVVGRKGREGPRDRGTRPLQAGRGRHLVAVDVRGTTMSSSQRDVPVLLGRQGLPLVGQYPQGLGHLHAGVRRRDDRVDVAAVGRDVGIEQRVLVLGDELGPARVRVLGRGDLLAVQDAGRTLRTHDGDLRGRPGEVQVGAEVLGPHDVVRAAVRLAGDDGDLGNGGLAVRVDQRGAAADHAVPFLAGTGQEAGHVDEREDRQVERVAGTDEPGPPFPGREVPGARA